MKNLLPQDKENIMKTIPNTYNRYRAETIRIEKAIKQARDETIGRHNQAVTIARRMISNNLEISLISKFTGLEETFIRSIVPKY